MHVSVYWKFRIHVAASKYCMCEMMARGSISITRTKHANQEAIRKLQNHISKIEKLVVRNSGDIGLILDVLKDNGSKNERIPHYKEKESRPPENNLSFTDEAVNAVSGASIEHGK